MISILQLRKLRNRIKLLSQGTYGSKCLSSKPRSCDPVFNYIITPHTVSQLLGLEDSLAYDRPVDLDSMEIKTQETIFLKNLSR